MSKKKMVTYIIWKGDSQVMGVGVKMRAVETVLEFLKDTMGVDYFDGRNSYAIRLPDTPGDADWLRKNCIGEGDIVGSTSINDSAERARRCAERYEEKKAGTDRVGHSILGYYLEHFYMKYDIWED